MKYKKITCFLVTVCLAATLNGFPVIAMENDTAIQGVKVGMMGPLAGIL